MWLEKTAITTQELVGSFKNALASCHVENALHWLWK